MVTNLYVIVTEVTIYTMKKPPYKEAGNTFETIDLKDILKDKKMHKDGVLSPNQPIKTVKGLLKFHALSPNSIYLAGIPLIDYLW
jgi:hypothetical protein